MKKLLRLSLMMLLTLISSMAFAQTTVIFTAGTDKGADGGKAGKDVTLTKDGITLHATNGNNNAGVFGRTDNYRIYKGATLEVSSTVGNITKVVFTSTVSGSAQYGPGCFGEPSTGTYTVEDKVGTWTGNAASFTITAVSAQVRATKIEVTYTAGGETPATVAAPQISGTTPFTDKTTVTITIPAGTTVYYTTNGANPDDNCDEYTDPFEITKTTTVKAVAYDKDNNRSEVTTKTFELQSGTTTDKEAADIAAFNALEVGTNAWLTLKDAQVVYTWTSNNGNNSTYIRDASGALQLRNCGLDLKVNDVLNGTVYLKRDAYNENIQAAKTDNTNKNSLTITESAAATPKAINYADAKNNVSDLVVLDNVDIVADGSRFYIGTGDDRLQVYNGFHIDGYEVAEGTGLTVKGIITRFRKTYEIQPVEVPTSAATGITDIKAAEAGANAPLFNLAGQRVGNDYKGVVVKNGKKFLKK